MKKLIKSILRKKAIVDERKLYQEEPFKESYEQAEKRYKKRMAELEKSKEMEYEARKEAKNEIIWR